MATKRNQFIIASLQLMLLLACLFRINVSAAGTSYSPSPILYENSKGFSMTDSSVSAFSYGKGMGSLVVNGEIGNKTTKDGVEAYPVNGTVTFGYSYGNGYITDNIDAWNLVDSSNSPYYDEKVETGEIIIQKSKDKKNWEMACDPFTDVFADKKVNLTSLYTVPERDIKTGTFYRVLVLYEMRRRTGTTENMIGWDSDVFENIYCIEDYIFYLSNIGNPLIIRDIVNRNPIVHKSEIQDGFVIDLNGNSGSVTVKKDNANPVKANSYEAFYAPGTYEISTTTSIGDTYKTTIKVTDGLSVASVKGVRYETDGRDDYSFENKMQGDRNLSSLIVAQKAGRSIRNAKDNDYEIYGISGNKANVFLSVSLPKDCGLNGWEVLTDEWGEKEKQTISGVWSGPVLSGTLIVQKSDNGQKWFAIENSKYANGLNTSNYYSNFGGTGIIPIYIPDGKDVLNGTYYRVLYAYQIRKIGEKETRRCIEEYRFRLCDEDLGAVTFHNLTVKDKVADIKEYSGEKNEITLEMNQKAETMENGAVTVSGFLIDKSLNPTVKHTVVKNDTTEMPASQFGFTETGKYDIKLTSMTGSTKSITLYVDRLSKEETLSVYFGDAFIKDKRIFDEEAKYPVFEGGKTQYNFAKIPDCYQPLYGEIVNNTTGEKIKIEETKSGKTGKLNTPGDYTAVFSDNPTYKSNSPSGDNKTITFNFEIIAEGSAPGPQKNQKSLTESMKKDTSGSYPMYYGLNFPSATVGDIELAFSTWEAARKFSYDYEKGLAEEQPDGSYLYSRSKDEPKKRYESIWKLTSAINEYADKAVNVMFFDMSNESTYLTLDEEISRDVNHLKDLHLSRSVVVFANGEAPLLKDLDALPILNDKPNSYLPVGDGKTSVSSPDEFKFVKDIHGYDSERVTIIDSTGERVPIEYDRGVEKQLAAAGCSTGVVTIKEETIYGDSNSYKAVYFANGDNTAKVTVLCYEGDKTIEKTLSKGNTNEVINTNAFSIKSIEDNLDPYDLIVVKDPKGNMTPFVADQSLNEIWSDKGKYEVTVINRIGNKYSFSIEIEKSNFATISFKGEGTSDFQPIMVRYADRNIELPIPERKGFEFVKYMDEDGTDYSDIIEQIDFEGSKVLAPIWRPKRVSVILKDTDGTVLDTIKADMGVEIELPTPDLSDNREFIGWINNGSVLKDNCIIITEENDVYLEVSATDGSQVSVSESKPENQADNEESKSNMVIPAIIVLMAGSGFFIIRMHRRKTRVDRKKTGSRKDLEPDVLDISARTTKTNGKDESK